MKRTLGLRRQIILSLGAMALGSILLSFIGSYVFYALALMYSPSSISETWIPSPAELIWLVATIIAALAIGVYVAIRLSLRILKPLNSVAHNLREVAQGNLQARAVMDSSALGETAQLVRDFNTMAERLQTMTLEREFWNAAIAHELRTPVTILRGRLQGLSEGVFSPSTELFNGLLRQTEGLGRLIEDLRILSLNDSGHLKLDLASTHLAQHVDLVVHAFRDRLIAQGFHLNVTLDPDLLVECDAIRIRQALMALLENALKHAEPGTLHIAGSVTEEHNELRVTDDGPGIDPEIAAHIFEAFRRGEPSRSRKSGGSGLGLAVVKGIAQAHGGEAICQPSGSGGTTFILRWPTSSLASRVSPG